MQIFITGGTGFIGQALVEALLAQGHQLTLLTRKPRADKQGVKYCQDLARFPDFNGFDAVINLAGEPIFDKRWTQEQKAKLVASRVDLTRQVVAKIQQSSQPPHTLISGSATGIYGSLAEKGDETTACSQNFAAQLCQAWEAAALEAQSEQTRVCLVRTGMVMHPKGGALKRMLPLYRLGLGGRLGSGQQHWAWISLADQVKALLFLLENPACQGAFNFVAPNLLTQADFNRTLAQQLKRPAFCHAPAFMLKLVLGERAHLLLDNQPLVPQKLLDAGYKFTHRSLSEALLQPRI
ncbi:TIGR01777 family protein [Pasteurellaceae bacterium RH1A]|nr:TIGR01777 family protein [Pasteurellaceae bacterium RH1A]